MPESHEGQKLEDEAPKATALHNWTAISPEDRSFDAQTPTNVEQVQVMIRSRNFHYIGHKLFCENLDLSRLAGLVPKSECNEAGTPMYVYSKQQIMDNINAYKESFSDRNNIVGFSLKANTNPEILRLIYNAGLSVVAVSGFEVKLALEVGFPGNRIYFNGNGKRHWEMKLAVEHGCIMNVDSVFNARQLVQIVEAEDREVDVLLRMNIEIETQVHPYLKTASQKSKFGIVDSDFKDVLEVLLPDGRISVIGLHCHLGSTIEDVSVYTQLFKLLEKIITENETTLGNIRLVNVGGGLGINYYHDETKETPTIDALGRALPHDSRFTIMVEPGRSLIGNTGILLVQVIGVKRTQSQTFVVVDGSMTELLRPALYEAYHNILPVVKRASGTTDVVDFVGPVCESGDFLGKERTIILPNEDDYYAVMDCGAYCMAMASNYNLRAKPAEILVDGDKFRVIQERETFEQVVKRAGY
eukprot:maker-scaffold595_size129005-snap-gene-0.16 protein:Tk09119 transcript:maker-scaffold595_size129005-snap-gene-0.16-mRNA-1 annotation:"hypothetical protein DAPPUDRAFT_316211"